MENTNNMTQQDIEVLFKAMNVLDFRAYLKRNIITQLKTTVLAHCNPASVAIITAELERLLRPNLISLSYINPVEGNRQFIDRRNMNTIDSNGQPIYNWVQGRLFQAQNALLPAGTPAPVAPVAPAPIAPMAVGAPVAV